MIRHAAAVVVVLLVMPSPVRAQALTFKVGTAPANVHKSATTASPVIGRAPRGAVLEVTRELGSWVKIAWPAAEDGVGYLHVSTGTIARAAARGEQRTASSDASRPVAPSGPPIPPLPPSTARADRDAAAASPRPAAGYVRAPAHLLGVGGVVGNPGFGVGVAARAWSRRQVGLQVQLSRAARGDVLDRSTTIEFAPSAIYAMRDRVSDYWWLRPYVGAGPTLQRQAPDVVAPGGVLAETRLGVQAFGGGELTLASLPRFALSVDAGYRWLPEPSIGGDRSGVRVAVSGHWYLR
jgi:SH3 domain-containing protein